MTQYRKRGNPVEVEEIPAGMVYRVNDGGIISYHTKETFALLYEDDRSQPATKPESKTVAPITTPISTTPSDWITTTTTTPAREAYNFPDGFKSSDISVAKALSTGEWDGDFWVEENGRKIPRRFVDDLPAQFGPDAVNPDGDHGDVQITNIDEAVAIIIKTIPWAAPFETLIRKAIATGGTFSTWGEIHCFIVASSYAYAKVEHTADVPPCPTYWLSESQYWTSGIGIGRACRKNEDLAHDVAEAAKRIDWTAIQANFWKVALVLATVMAAGGLTIPELGNLILKTFFGG